MNRHFSLVAAVAVVGLAVGCTSVSERGEARAAPQSFGDADAFVGGGIVVDFKDGTTKEEFDAWEKEWGVDLEFNSQEGEKTGITRAANVADVAAAIERIRGHEDVEAVEPLMTFAVPTEPLTEVDVRDAVEGPDFPNDPLYAKQWNLKQIDAAEAWKRTRGKGVVVAVIDTGIAYEDFEQFKLVPDLKGAKFVKGYDFVNDDEHANDDHGHGTHVAGTIAQVTHNKEGVAGVAFEASLMPLKVLNYNGFGNSADISEAIRFAADNGAKVINMSLGGGGRSAVMESAVNYARKKGVTVVCAAGNSGIGRVEYPAAYPGSVAVSAVGPDGKRAFYSSYGKELDIAAPGGDKRRGEGGGVLQNTITRPSYTSVYAEYQGTSMATPHVAGVAALLYSAGARTPDQVEKALYAGARGVDGKKEWSDQYGHGLVNAKGALNALGASGGAGGNWSPLLWGAALLAAVLLSIKPRGRPGYLNVLFHPGFAIPLVVSTVGLFFVTRLIGAIGGAGGEVLEVVSLPIPDWERIIFGRGRLANPIFYSALIPLLASIVAIKAVAFRPVIAGLAIGFAGFLGYAAWAGAPGIAYLPFTFLAKPWLIINAVVALFVARAMLLKEKVS